MQTTSIVNGRFLFYDNSKFDHNAPGVSTSDDNAIATDKTAYLPGTGTATSANVSSYSPGINGIMIDLQGGGTHGSISLANILSDFTFKMGNNNTPKLWGHGSQPDQRFGLCWCGSWRLRSRRADLGR